MILTIVPLRPRGRVPSRAPAVRRGAEKVPWGCARKAPSPPASPPGFGEVSCHRARWARLLANLSPPASGQVPAGRPALPQPPPPPGTLPTAREVGHLPHIPHVTQVGPLPIRGDHERLTPSLLKQPLPFPHNTPPALPKMAHSDTKAMGGRGRFFPPGVEPGGASLPLPSPLPIPSSPRASLAHFAFPSPGQLDCPELGKCHELVGRLLRLHESQASRPRATAAPKEKPSLNMGRGWNALGKEKGMS